MPNKLTLGEWNNRLPRPRSHETVRRWIRAGKIYPAPELDGREYLFDERAVKIDPQNQRAPINTLLTRITNGPEPKPRKARSATKPVRS
ncbi:Excisionase-like protein [Serratia quinivorans]|nr:Excisionase-like protein [Serratia quinivorans]